MYLHLGQDTLLRTKDIIGIFDLDTSSTSKHTRNFLANAQKQNNVVTISQELPKSFIVTAQHPSKVYISQISAATLKKRSGFLQEISTAEET